MVVHPMIIYIIYSLHFIFFITFFQLNSLIFIAPMVSLKVHLNYINFSFKPIILFMPRSRKIPLKNNSSFEQNFIVENAFKRNKRYFNLSKINQAENG